MNKMIAAGLMCAFVSSALATEDIEGCVFDDKTVSPYESIWLEDETLVAQATLHFEEKGYTATQIKSALANNDWTGFRLACLPVVSHTSKNPPSTIGQKIEIIAYKMTFTDVSLDFFRSLKKAQALAAKEG